MKGILLDTNVVSEVARPNPDARVLTFLAAEADLWLRTSKSSISKWSTLGTRLSEVAPV